MALHLKSSEAERLARQLAEMTGETITESVTLALRERLERIKPAFRPSAEEIAAELLRVVAEIRERFDLTATSKAESDALWGEDDLFPGASAMRRP